MTTPDDAARAPEPPTEPPTDAPPDPPASGTADVRLPRGCNPLTFGVVMATIEMIAILWLWRRCA